MINFLTKEDGTAGYEMTPKRRRKLFTRFGFLLAASLLPLSAQWQIPKNSAAPRTKDGKPDLKAPAPRRPDGKPDLTGIWIADPPKLRGATIDLKPGELQMQPWAEELFKQRETGDLSALDPDANCLPQGVPKINSTPLPFKIFQEPNVVVVLYEAFDQFRQFFMDGRQLPKDANPSGSDIRWRIGTEIRWWSNLPASTARHGSTRWAILHRRHCA